MPSILADIYWAKSLLTKIVMILFTSQQLSWVLTQILEWRSKTTLLQFFPEVAENSLSFLRSEKSLSIPGLWLPWSVAIGRTFALRACSTQPTDNNLPWRHCWRRRRGPSSRWHSSQSWGTAHRPRQFYTAEESLPASPPPSCLQYAIQNSWSRPKTFLFRSVYRHW